MPYRIAADGVTIEHRKRGRWSTKQVATSKQNAHIILSKLTEMEKGQIAKFGDRMKARGK
jgi:hypothetical protein